MWTIGDYLAQLDAKVCLDDLRTSHDRIQNKRKKNSGTLNTDEKRFYIDLLPAVGSPPQTANNGHPALDSTCIIR
ncbi:hypothetical protein POVWA2_054700 [Plasmodium ovale wallikeri]|uniref:Uncharacterized protein n=1 Tax=Plasmodium ovale wallikeri TaxID=864142 RepID=A0A1A8ZUY7_PLAOA|nr:hypothetical protein POVWA1_056030 [Plasmodium ovale wallikeri]SBT47735.1 hypothetical protein POVWA2_054700 [Plasmodium ovale wallikeri]